MQRKGFTLIELLLVIGIVGLLSTLVAVALRSAQMKSWCDKQRIVDTEKCEQRYARHIKNDI